MRDGQKPRAAIWRKLTLSNWLVALIPMTVIFAAVSVIFLQAMFENQRQQSQRALDKACGEAELWVSQADEVLSILCMDINVQNVMSGFSSATLKERLDQRDFFRNRLLGLFTSDMQIANVSLYLMDTNTTYSQDYRDAPLDRAYASAEWFCAMLAGERSSALEWGESITDGRPTLKLARSIYSIRTGRLLGMGYVELSQNRIRDSFLPLCSDQMGAVTLSNGLAYGDADAMKEWDAVASAIPSLGLTAEYRFSVRSLRAAAALALGCFAAGLVLLMALIYWMDKRIANSLAVRIQRQVEATGRIAEGDLDIDLHDPVDDELGDLSRSLNHMAQDMKRLINEKYLAEIKRQQASLHALQSQINPHFIFNTLERISMLALINDQWEIVDMTQAFSALMRYAIAPGGLATLREEIESVEQYVSIQRSRFERPIEVAYDLEPDTTLTLPRLTLEPLIENAFRHGFDGGGGGAMRVGVSVRRTDGGVRVCISNNGAPVSGEREQEIRRLLDRPLDEEPTDCFALRNISQRIKLLFGERARLEIHSEAGEDTRVVLWLPPNDAEKGA